MAIPENAQPLVSVIIPTYNRPHYLSLALESVCQQTYQNLEIIVADDSVSDVNQATMDTFPDERIRYRRNAVNLGMHENKVTGYREARGKYIANLDDDDIWEADFLEKLIPVLEADPELSVAFSDHSIIDEEGRIDQAATESSTHRYKRDVLEPGVHRPFSRIGLVHNSVPMVQAAVFRKSAVDLNDFPEQVGTVSDYWLVYLACRSGQGAYYTPERLTRYRVHAQSETRTGKLRTCSGLVYCYQRLLEDARLQEFQEEFSWKYAYNCFGLGTSMLWSGRSAEARPYLWKGLRARPPWRVLAALTLSLLPGAWLKFLNPEGQPTKRKLEPA
jgi:glycosyltransferase involved in cell wall biosynthesis